MSTGGQILAGAGVIFSKCQSRLWDHSFKMRAPVVIFENAEAGSGECQDKFRKRTGAGAGLICENAGARAGAAV